MCGKMICPKCKRELSEREVLSLYGAAMSRRRRKRAGGNPRKVRYCGRGCGFTGGAREIRRHVPQCRLRGMDPCDGRAIRPDGQRGECRMKLGHVGPCGFRFQPDERRIGS